MELQFSSELSNVVLVKISSKLTTSGGCAVYKNLFEFSATFFVIATLSLLSGCATDNNAAQMEALNQFPETMKVTMPNANWLVANTWSNNGISLTESIPNNETLAEWNQMISIRYISYDLEGQQSLIIERVNDLEKSIRKTCKNLEWGILKQAQNDITYQWQVRNCGQGILADQIEIARIVRSRYGYNSVQYAVKGTTISPQMRKQMLQVVESARVVNAKSSNAQSTSSCTQATS